MLKKIIAASTFATSALFTVGASASLPCDFYVSGQVGYADTHMKSKLPFELSPFHLPTSGLSNDGIAGRLALGYHFDKNFALELGYLQLPTGKLSNPEGTLYLKQNTFDLAGKGTLPLNDKVNIYGKLGLAYITSRITEKSTLETPKGDSLPITYDYNDIAGIAKHKWAPEAVVGIGYDVTPNIAVDTSFTHIHPMGNSRPGNIDFLAVGLTYNFG